MEKCWRRNTHSLRSENSQLETGIPIPHGLQHSSFDVFPRASACQSGNQVVACSLQSLKRGGCMLFPDQYVVRVERGDGKYGDAALGQGIEESCEDSGQRKCEGTFQLEAGPGR